MERSSKNGRAPEQLPVERRPSLSLITQCPRTL
jgi:hypothetical protein